MKNIYKALLEAQKQITHAVKDAKNPHFKNNYATLESVIDAVKKPLNDVGIFITHSTSADGQLTTSLVHSESGEVMSTTSVLLMTKQDMQQMGSAQTYAKRYNLTALLNLPTEDDDGNLASKPQENKQYVKTQEKPVNVTAAIQGQKVEAKQQGNLGEFVCNIGKKYKGLKLNEMKDFEIASFSKWLVEQASQQNKTISGPTLEFIEKADLYLKSFQSNDPKFDDRETIPF